MLLHDLARTSQDLAQTPSRTAKAGLVAQCLALATPDEVALVVGYLSGELPQRRTGLGPAALRNLPPPAAEPTVGLGQVDRVFERVAGASGPGSSAARRAELVALMAAATAVEQRLLAGLVVGEVRHGALAGVMVDAVARASGLPLVDVRRAVMLRGSLPAVATTALTEGAAGVAAFGLQVGRPLQPMLAQTADGIVAALARISPAAIEEKLDGIRTQVHRDGDDVHVFTRSLEEITARVPEIVELVRALPVRRVVLDGEALALRDDGRPLPFQQTASRTGRSLDVAGARRGAPLRPFFFDMLHVDGQDLLTAPADERAKRLAEVVPADARVRRLVTGDPDAAAAFLGEVLVRGHEGVVVKALDAPYEAGRRGAGWLKVKPRHTLDLVVLAAEWGHGRRTGWLSNLHLAAADGSGGWVMLGKTFKGLTDEMLTWQTARLLELASDPAMARQHATVPVRPELVVEVAFDGVQTSSRYPGGLALRFARVLRHRPDKPTAEADPVSLVRALHAGAAPEGKDAS